MKMTWKSGLVVAGLAAGLLAGCGAEDKAVTRTPEQIAADKAAEERAAAEKAAAEKAAAEKAAAEKFAAEQAALDKLVTDPVTLTVTAPAGTSVSYVAESASTQDIDMGGMAFSVVSKTKAEVTMTITAVDDAGVRAVAVKFDRVSGSMESAMMGGTISYDTGDPAGNADPMGMGIDKVLSALGGETVTANMDAKGNVSDISGIQAIVDGATAGNPMLAQFVSAADMTETVRGFFSKLPDEPVATGGTWNHDLNMKPRPGMSLDIASVMTAGAIDGRTASYTAVTKITAGEGTAEGTSIDESASQGEGKISRADGLLVETSGENVMKVTMPNPQMPGSSMSVAVKSTSSVKRVEATADDAADSAGDDSGE